MAFGQDIANIQGRLASLEMARAGERLFGAISKTEGKDLREVDDLLRGGPNIDLEQVVNYRDVGGMTPLHRAACLGNAGLVQQLMGLKGDAHATSYASRNPGYWTPLLCLAEADMPSMDREDTNGACRALLNGMAGEAVAQQTDK